MSSAVSGSSRHSASAAAASTAGAARRATQLSWRPATVIVARVMVVSSTVCCGLAMEGVGRNVTSNTTSMPLVIPAFTPPERLVTVRTAPSDTAKGSLASLPRRAAKSCPAPKPTALTAGMANTWRAISLSTLSRQSGPPSPAGSPVTVQRITPPTLSPSR